MVHLGQRSSGFLMLMLLSMFAQVAGMPTEVEPEEGDNEYWPDNESDDTLVTVDDSGFVGTIEDEDIIVGKYEEGEEDDDDLTDWPC